VLLTWWLVLRKGLCKGELIGRDQMGCSDESASGDRRAWTQGPRIKSQVTLAGKWEAAERRGPGGEGMERRG
jgi:hypothetical protein